MVEVVNPVGAGVAGVLLLPLHPQIPTATIMHKIRTEEIFRTNSFFVFIYIHLYYLLTFKLQDIFTPVFRQSLYVYTPRTAKHLAIY
jgi:hypothetical protein